MKDLIKHKRQLLGIAKSWAMQHVVGWSDDSHRDLIAGCGAQTHNGRISATTMSLPQLDAALVAYERRGWVHMRRTFKQGRVLRTVPARIAKIVRLWAVLGEHKKIQNSRRAALLQWCGRQLNKPVKNLDVLTHAECQSITEALKHWVDR